MKSGDPYEAAGEDFAQMLRECGLRDDTAAPGRKVVSGYVLRTLIQDGHYIFGQLPLIRKV